MTVRYLAAFAMLMTSILATPAAARAQDTAIFTEILHGYVKEGNVDYKSLCADHRLGQYIQKISEADPDRLSNGQDKLAFWINAYNAYTLKVICDHYPVKSIKDLSSYGLAAILLKTTVWDRDFVVIHGSRTTLNHIEHEVIRPQFRDPRAHFALVCASRSCPPLRSEAFEGAKLSAQLDDQARIFLSDPSRNRFDLTSKKAHLSKIFDWYGKDFGSNQNEMLTFISKFVKEPVASSLKNNSERWDVSFLEYDWSLNDLQK